MGPPILRTKTALRVEEGFHRGRGRGGQAEGEPRGEAARDVSLYLDSMPVHARWKFQRVCCYVQRMYVRTVQ